MRHGWLGCKAGIVCCGKAKIGSGGNVEPHEAAAKLRIARNLVSVGCGGLSEGVRGRIDVRDGSLLERHRRGRVVAHLKPLQHDIDICFLRQQDCAVGGPFDAHAVLMG